MALDRFDEVEVAFDAVGRWVVGLGMEWTDVFGCVCCAMLLLHWGDLDDAVAEGNAGLIRVEELQSWKYVLELCAVLVEANAYWGEFGSACRQLWHGVSRVYDPSSVGVQRLAWASVVVDEIVGEEFVRVFVHFVLLYQELLDGLQVLALDSMVGPCLVGLARRAHDAKRVGMAVEVATIFCCINGGVISFAAVGMQAGGLLDDDVDSLVVVAHAFEVSFCSLACVCAVEDVVGVLFERSWCAEAVEQLDLALVEYDRAGAVVFGRCVWQRLSEGVRLGMEQSIVERPSFGWSSLMAAEFWVVRLAAIGLINRAIAEELDVFLHTVESHLWHVYRKLDVWFWVELIYMVLIRELVIYV